MPKILIPASMRTMTQQQAIVQVQAETVVESLLILVQQYPDLSAALFSQPGKLHSFVNLYLDGRNIRDEAGMETKVTEQQNLLILPALSGG